MSNGIEGGGGLENRTSTQTERATPDEYARAVSRVAAGQICESVGFERFDGSALDSLAEVMIRYIRDLGKVTASHANLAGRTQSNVFDVVRGLEDLGFGDCNGGGSNVGHCVGGSGVVSEVIKYVNGSEDDVPFAQPLARFPVVLERRMVPSFVEMGEVPAGKHIPEWLPAFPDPHTYVHTPMWNERKSDPKQDKIEQVRQRRKAERALLGLQQRLNCNGSAGPSDAVADLIGSKDFQTNGTASLLETLRPCELKKNVENGVSDKSSDETVVDKNPVTVLEAFAPAIEAANGGVCELVDGDQKGLNDRRPLVFLKLGSGRKLLGRPSVLGLQSRSCQRRRALGRDDERGDKKRRVEIILRQSMENPQELTQL